MRQFEAWGQTDVTFGQLTDETFANLADTGVTLDGATSPTTHESLGAGAGIAVTFNAATVTMDGDTVTYGYTAVPSIAALNQQASLTTQRHLSIAVSFTSYDALLIELNDGVQAAEDRKESGRVVRGLGRAYQHTLTMNAEGRPLDDWLRIAGALVVTAAMRDADRARARARITARRSVHAHEWAANALEEAGA